MGESQSTASQTKEALAAAMLGAERELRLAQAALARDDSNAARARYAKARAECQRLEAALPMVLGQREPGEA